MSFKKAAPLGIVCGSSKSKHNLWLSGIITVCSKIISQGYIVYVKKAMNLLFLGAVALLSWQNIYLKTN